MKEALITFETAKLLKSKGFPNINNGLNNMYNEKGILYNSVGPTFYEINSFQAPTQSLVQKWLREKYKFHFIFMTTTKNKYVIIICKLNGVGHCGGLYHKEDIKFKTYEEALEQCINESLNNL